MIQGRKLAITASAAARATASIPHQPSGFLPTCGDPTLARDLPFRNVSSTKEWGSQSIEDVLDSALQRPKSFWKCLQHRCKSHGKLSGVCNSVASPTKNFSAFATPLQVSRKTFWRLQHRCKSHEKLSGVCNTVASPTKNFLAFATPLQVPRKTFWRLQHRCKSHEKLSGVCGSPASLSRNFLVFAGVPQVPREMLWCLRECCKHFQKRFGRGVASVETADSILTPNPTFRR